MEKRFYCRDGRKQSSRVRISGRSFETFPPFSYIALLHIILFFFLLCRRKKNSLRNPFCLGILVFSDCRSAEREARTSLFCAAKLFGPLALLLTVHPAAGISVPRLNLYGAFNEKWHEDSSLLKNKIFFLPGNKFRLSLVEKSKSRKCKKFFFTTKNSIFIFSKSFFTSFLFSSVSNF